MVTIHDVALAVHQYAPRLDETEKVKFSMYVHNQFAYADNLNELNLRNEWTNYQA